MRPFLRGFLATAAASLLLAGCSGGGPAPHEKPAVPVSRKPVPRPTPTWNAHPASIAALGDSITRGFDACSLLADCPEVSWVTGTRSQVDSIAGRVLSATGIAANSWNLARSGARMSDLPDQAVAAAAKKPSLVTVLMGSNDACRDSADDMTPVADFRADFTRAMTGLHSALPKSQVFVASIPDLKRLWEVGKENPLGKQIWKLGICPSMLRDADSVSESAQTRRDAVRARVVAYNRVLKEVCAKYEHCRYDGGAVFDYRFTSDELSSWDWFHPNAQGQAQLARILYTAAFAKP
ncbi:MULTISPECIES: SGNH/GDSL hydrolase family protein [unclassified Streptomyces]|uniref:SGNH/GDSL hydrolase family protein n=1 Tax=unclassified Streptomyces TaxID=2593676 RepID=UPI002033C64F|nr:MULTISPECIES: SGNH/GDSL hydrolase family protein [unclassified Streptomyces]MCM2419233.1 SGNH/GDSL hydrolase family protein [Streptomyces sp. RKAG293]MCM2428579.1 SGNH/GDSL hydrolase family protein [Streptomyces sp. RKAG337]